MRRRNTPVKYQYPLLLLDRPRPCAASRSIDYLHARAVTAGKRMAERTHARIDALIGWFAQSRACVRAVHLPIQARGNAPRKPTETPRRHGGLDTTARARRSVRSAPADARFLSGR